MSEEKKWMDLNGSICKEDIDEAINAIVADNRFDRSSFMKECGISHLVKKITIDHLMTICRYKGYVIKMALPEDTLFVSYYLEGNEVKTPEAPINEIVPEESKSDNNLDFLDD